VKRGQRIRLQLGLWHSNGYAFFSGAGKHKHHTIEVVYLKALERRGSPLLTGAKMA
jgi:hypothetical protein